MTTIETLADDIERMRDAGHRTIPVPLDLAELLVNLAKAHRAMQGQPIPFRARVQSRKANA